MVGNRLNLPFWGSPSGRRGASRVLWLIVAGIVVGALVLGAIVWFGSAEIRSTFGNWRARAVLLWKNGRYDEAIANFKKALEADPDDVKSMRGIARCHMGKGDLRSAAEWAERAIKHDDTALAQVLRAEIALKAAGVWEPVPGETVAPADHVLVHLTAAAKHARAALKIDAEHGPAYRTLAEATARLGDLPGALAHIRRAIRVKPDGREERLVAAELFLLQGNGTVALEHLRHILDHADTVVGTRQGRRVVHRAMRRAIQVQANEGQWDGALELCDRMAELRFDRQFVAVHRAWCHLGKGDAARAVAEADKAEETSGEIGMGPLFFWVRGTALLRVDDYDRAITDFHRLTVQQPTNPLVHWRLGQANAGAKRRGPAIDAYQAAIKIDARLFGARVELAELLVEEGRFDDALKLLRGGVDILQDNEEAHKLACQGLVEFCQRHARGDLAERELVRLLQIEPGSLGLAFRLSSLYLDRGRAELALPLARHAMRLEPRSAATVHLLARAEAAGGLRELAAGRFALAVSLDPKFRPAYFDWARLCAETGQTAAAEDVFERARKALGDPADVRIAHANLRLASGRAEEGLAELRAILKADPRDIPARAALVEHYLDSDLDRALAEARLGVEALPQSVPAHSLLARVRRARREWEPFLVQLRYIAQRLDREAFVCYQRLAANVRLRRFEAAVAVGREAVTLHRDRARLVKLDLGIALFLAGEREEGLDQVQLVGGENPFDADAGIIASLMRFLATGTPPRAPACRREALHAAALEAWADFAARARQHPDLAKDEAVALLEACVFEHAGWTDEAARRAVAAQELAPDSRLLHALVPVLWERTGRRREAIAAARRAVEAAPGLATPRELLADLLMSDGDADRAADLYAAPSPGNMGTLDMLTKRAFLAMARDRTAEAAAAWRAVLELDARHVVACNNLAWLLATQPGGDVTEALRLIAVAQNRAGENPAVLDTAGWVHFQAEHYGDAVKLLVEAVKGDPHRAVYHFHLGMAYARQGKAEDARRALLDALALDPTGGFVHEARQALAGLGS